jgi:hypothetical protein
MEDVSASASRAVASQAVARAFAALELRAPNAEQARAVALVESGASVLVDAVPGSGKTTCVLHMARSLPGRTFCLVTFNRALAEETSARMTALGLCNASAHTFHGLIGAALRCAAHDDEALEAALDALADRAEASTALAAALAPCTDLVVDEAQDVRPLLFRAWAVLVAHARAGARTHVLGDRRQGVYASMSADARFLTLADALLGRRVERVNFCQSHRLTASMARFVNDVLLGTPGAVCARKPGPPVCFWRVNRTSAACAAPVARALVARICGAPSPGAAPLTPGDVFVLFPTVRRGLMGGCAALFSRILRAAGVPVFASHEQESGDISALAARNKVVLTTHHQAKGRERALTVAFGCDASLIRAPTGPAGPAAGLAAGPAAGPPGVPDQLFVATTRALHELWVVQMGDALPAVAAADAAHVLADLVAAEALVLCPPTFEPWTPWAQPSVARPMADAEADAADAEADAHADALRPKKRGVAELATFLKPEARAALTALVALAMECIQPPARAAAAPNEVPSAIEGSTEVVADINGVAVVADFEARTRAAAHGNRGGGVCTVYDRVRLAAGEPGVRSQPPACQARFAQAAAAPPQTPAEFLRVATAFCAHESGHWHKQQQVLSFAWSDNRATWWDPALAEIDAFTRAHGVPAAFECSIEGVVPPPPPERTTLRGPLCLSGRIDAVHVGASGVVAYEFRATAALTLEHKVQAMLYALLLTRAARAAAHSGSVTVLLLNVLTGEAWRVKAGAAADVALAAACEEAVCNAFRVETRLSDADFIRVHAAARELESDRREKKLLLAVA